MAKTKITRASLDWKGDNDDILDSLTKALEHFGIVVFQSESLRVQMFLVLCLVTTMRLARTK